MMDVLAAYQECETLDARMRFVANLSSGERDQLMLLKNGQGQRLYDLLTAELTVGRAIHNVKAGRPWWK